MRTQNLKELDLELGLYADIIPDSIWFLIENS